MIGQLYVILHPRNLHTFNTTPTFQCSYSSKSVVAAFETIQGSSIHYPKFSFKKDVNYSLLNIVLLNA